MHAGLQNTATHEMKAKERIAPWWTGCVTAELEARLPSAVLELGGCASI